jgi:ElaB/YqjD/DUF883 family membrane-anchored ribosome-binding protein
LADGDKVEFFNRPLNRSRRFVMPTNEHTAQRTADQLRDKAGEIRQNVQDLGTAARDAAQQVAGQIRDTATQRASELRDAAADQVAGLRDAAGDYYEMGRGRAMDLEQTIEQRIREKPLQSMLVAAGVGLLVGALWIRR